MVTRREPEEMVSEVARFTREEFLRDYWDYKPGQHVTILAPSGGGKTQWGFQLLGHTASPKMQATVLCMKERDDTVSKFAKQYNFKILRNWPPPKITFGKKPPGYVLWPPGHEDEAVEAYRHSQVFKRAIRDLYWNHKHTDRIIFADETYSLEEELGLTKAVNRVHTKGRGMHCGIWCASQRPAFISGWAYQANHIFLGNEPDRRARDRFGEIASGIDPALIRAITESLAPFEFLYIKREGRRLCIVGAS